MLAEQAVPAVPAEAVARAEKAATETSTETAVTQARAKAAMAAMAVEEVEAATAVVAAAGHRSESFVSAAPRLFNRTSLLSRAWAETVAAVRERRGRRDCQPQRAAVRRNTPGAPGFTSARPSSQSSPPATTGR